MLIRRTRKKPFRGYTDENGMRTPDAPKNWPFGRVEVRKSIARPRVGKSRVSVKENQP